MVKPLDPAIEDDLLAMQVAAELNLPAPSVRSLPLHWIGSALVRIEARELLNRREREKDA